MSSANVRVRIGSNVEELLRNLGLSEVKLLRAGCLVCDHYLTRRGNTVLVAVTVKATRYDLVPAVLLARYMRSVHDRHLAGESLATRPVTPVKRTGPKASLVTVQRSCDGCGKSLGDANPDELNAAVAGWPLPDVRLECGCWTEDQA